MRRRGARRLPTAITKPPRLTAFSRGAGCGCKLPPSDLYAVLGDLKLVRDERLLIGIETADDAGIIKLSSELALVQTVDFFTPIVDDPRSFGAIAAANALSDVYAMGGEPLSALSIVAFPLERLGGEVLRSILEGALEVLNEAGTLLVGGHSIDDPEPKFGLAVTGTVDPDCVLSNSAGRPGDALVLTKPLGTGAIATLAKHGEVAPDLLAQAISVMRTLNRDASVRALAAGAHAATDVTGFGLLGHLHAMAHQSGLSAQVSAELVPAISGVRELLVQEQGISGGTRRVAAWAAGFSRFGAEVPAWRRWLMADATTSGGLLVAVAPERASEVPGQVFGSLISGPAGIVEVA
jgi:selenide,water dikinase